MTAEGIWVLIGSSLLLYSSIYQEPAAVSQDEKKKKISISYTYLFKVILTLFLQIFEFNDR